MSRIQNILEKAEREGAVRRVRPQVEDIAAVGAVDGRAAMTPQLASPSAFEAPQPAAPIATPVPSVRVVTGTRLSPPVLAALSPSTAAEQYRALRTRIVHSETGGPVNVVLITSPGRGDGKSLTAANLGLAMAQEYQQRICVVDADFRSPQQRRLFGLPETPGLADVLLSRATLEEAVMELEEYHISVLPAGTQSAHPAELFGTTTMRRTLETLRSRFDRIVIDSPAATPLADVGILAPLVDSIVLIVRAGYTSKPAIHDAIAAIDAAKLLGVVLNEAA
jgi:capsular exopolysaccharide synthesis family protein